MKYAIYSMLLKNPPRRNHIPSIMISKNMIVGTALFPLAKLSAAARFNTISLSDSCSN
ncbi:hypothetical protein GCM10008910_06560 [Faecalicatena orotica]